MTAMVLYNIWQAINLMLRAQGCGGTMTDGEQKRYRVTMPFMVTIFCAHLNGRI